VRKNIREAVGVAEQRTGPAQKDGQEANVRAYANLSVVPAVYGIATLELIVQRNRPNIQPGEGAWGFGQIIALILILGSIIDIVVTVRERRTGEGNPSEEAGKSGS